MTKLTEKLIFDVIALDTAISTAIAAKLDEITAADITTYCESRVAAREKRVNDAGSRRRQKTAEDRKVLAAAITKAFAEHGDDNFLSVADIEELIAEEVPETSSGKIVKVMSEFANNGIVEKQKARIDGSDRMTYRWIG